MQVGNLKDIYHFGICSERMSPMSRNDGEVYTEQLQSDPNVSGFKRQYLIVMYFCCVQVGVAIQQCLQKRSKQVLPHHGQLNQSLTSSGT